MVAERAFIIDKEPESVKRLSVHLKKMGFFVEEESDPRSALKRFKNGSCEFDIIFIEQKMPIISGVDILNELHAADCKSCVIFMTEKPDLKTIVSVMQEGAFSFLEKPIDYNQLKEVVKKGLENRQAFFQILEMDKQLKKSNSKLKRQSENLKKEKSSLRIINNELNLLNQLSLEINSTLDAHKMLDKVVNGNHCKLNELLEHNIVTFFYFLGEEAFLKIHSPFFSPGSEMVKQLRHASIKEYSHYTGEKLLADDIHTEVIKGKALKGKKNKKPTVAIDKSIYIPLNVADDVLGIMGLVGVQKISENRSRLISTMANQVALALKNATEHKRVQELAITDELTGLYNRRAFHKALDKELRRSKRYKKPLSLIMLDIDGFKAINDKFGHQAGDGVLRSLALNLQRAIREIDFLARYGGDEFAVILPETEAKQAAVLAERLKKTVKNYTIDAGGSLCNITLSMGVADISASVGSEDDLISRADSVLYMSKENGGDSVEVLCKA